MSENTAAPRFTPPTVDPWKGLRGVMAGTLILELIVVLLCLPVVWKIGGGLTWISGGYLGLIAVAMVLACGMQGRPYALQLDLALQVAIIVGGVFHWSIAVIGVVFLSVWLYIGYIKRDIQQRIDEGRLAGQRPIDEI
ncbi:DUF4233 domain-containing protein [Gordonia sp. (in: high G+C Gram-positive bacteria)]|jgi:hypothetical protein|uniref:DUF4233 domain-containing protein n=1 Tax=Gordonia sp. (in: high G+C Gram-positive bacteria) TaxID=84139 RepID=UPI001D79D04C|nr:DUF4233 domain-containing protein [Gordonia sp. (in: high G+C Gram-positive bacteria)]MCB1297255.1 DUF4233 domain-containing protein [Gordonia sp. (in: high G+C Gram-positive bacteria)]HMS73742.1 DUF4233 domain-containing protein [Gordonia sp. (in: high G+C Gram-positive bacteria)]HQV18293.1 DUF4233 domain-containing protein [Gordonia sp. (in: high G+C Gram-positive bacteria)]